MNLYFAKRLIPYYLFSRHRKGHGIHSPFIFNLVSEVFNNKPEESIVKKVEKMRSDLRRDRRIIKFTDYGAGSLKLKCKERRVSDIVRYSAVRTYYGQLLSKLAKMNNGKSIIEFGTSLGISTMYMALGAPLSRVFTMEGCNEVAAIARTNFELCEINNVDLSIGRFEDVLDDILMKAEVPGMVFVDGNHLKEPVLKYIKRLKEIMDDDTILIVDDIHYSKEMEEAWDGIKQSEDVSVTIDILQMGLVFFRKGMSKQSYIIKY
jgi:predicted O-methyltransferase YrrM